MNGFHVLDIGNAVKGKRPFKLWFYCGFWVNGNGLKLVFVQELVVVGYTGKTVFHRDQFIYIWFFAVFIVTVDDAK